MYRIRFHGRGGQGIKVAGRILGTAFFLEGFEVQDAPRYGAERRGAPIFAYVRAGRSSVNERGIVRHPDLVTVADDTLVPIPAAGVLEGLTESTVLLIYSREDQETWRQRLGRRVCRLLILPPDMFEGRGGGAPFAGAICAGAAARLTGEISVLALRSAVRQELTDHPEDIIEYNQDNAVSAYEYMEPYQGWVTEGRKISAEKYRRPDWIDIPFEDALVAAPVIRAAATSEKMPTGLWRTMRPEIDYSRCRRCWWICGTLCPDSAIDADEQDRPAIDYKHCKGCMICAAACPSHAIEITSEKETLPREKGGDR